MGNDVLRFFGRSPFADSRTGHGGWSGGGGPGRLRWGRVGWTWQKKAALNAVRVMGKQVLDLASNGDRGLSPLNTKAGTRFYSASDPIEENPRVFLQGS